MTRTISIRGVKDPKRYLEIALNEDMIRYNFDSNPIFKMGPDTLDYIARCFYPDIDDHKPRIITIFGCQVITSHRFKFGDIEIFYPESNVLPSCRESYRPIRRTPYAIKKVIFNNPATIVYWEDGTRTVVKKQKGDKFDKEKGLAMAFMKKHLGNEGNYYNEVERWIE